MKIFETNLKRGKFDKTRHTSDGRMLEFAHIYPMDALYDTPSDVPKDVSENKRYLAAGSYTISEVVQKVKEDSEAIDILVRISASFLKTCF